MNKLYHIRPVMESFIWGGRKIIEKYHLDTELCNVGIMYQVIALPGRQDNLVEETGETLSQFYGRHPGLFNCSSRLFPIRMAVSCGEKKMSYHLHPGDAYALAHEGTRGKVTGSVAVEPSDTVCRKLFGNKARSLEEFKELAGRQDWERLFQTVEVKDGDFLHTPAGVIHGGGGEGKMAMTFSANSDITYRFYDYGRNDPDRPLHLEQVYDCVNIPEVPLGAVHAEPIRENGLTVYHYYDEAGEYTAKRIDVDGAGCYEMKEFFFLFCSDGAGNAGEETLRAGETLFIPAEYGPLNLSGSMKLYLISYRNAG